MARWRLGILREVILKSNLQFITELQQKQPLQVFCGNSLPPPIGGSSFGFGDTHRPQGVGDLVTLTDLPQILDVGFPL